MSSSGIPRDYEDEADSITERLDYLEDEASDAVGRSLDSLSNFVDDLTEEGARAFDTIERQVEEHPWISLMVGFGLGCLLGAFLRRD